MAIVEVEGGDISELAERRTHYLAGVSTRSLNRASMSTALEK